MIHYMALSDICLNIVDCPHETPEWKSEGIPVIRNFNLVDGQLDLSNGFYVDEETFMKRTRRAVPSEGDIIFSREAPIGNCAIVPKDFKCCLGQRLVLLQVNHDICSSDYLLTVLQSSYVQQQIEQVSKRGSIVSNFAIGDLKELIIPVLDNREDIARITSTLLAIIKNNTAICSDLEAMADFLYDYWFVQFDFPDKDGRPYKTSGGKMVWNDALKREIPEGWEVHSADAFLKIVKGISYSAGDLIGNGMKMLNLNSFNEDGSYKVEGIKTFSGKVPDERTLVTNDLIMCATQQTDIDLSGKKNVIGKAILVPDLDETTMTYSMDVVKLVAEEKKYLPFFKYQFGLPHAHKYIVGYANGTKIKHLDVSNALSLPVAMPGKGSMLIDEFASYAFSINKKISGIITENQLLISLRDFLLPMLMSGQVKVAR